jgi:hypothetical protein
MVSTVFLDARMRGPLSSRYGQRDSSLRVVENFDVFTYYFVTNLKDARINQRSGGCEKKLLTVGSSKQGL